MIHEFMTLRYTDGDIRVEDQPSAILMERVEAIFPGTMKDSIGCTHIIMKSGDQYITPMPYEEVLDIWKTCTDKIEF